MNTHSPLRAAALLAVIGLAAIVTGWLVNRLPVEWFLAVTLGAGATGLVLYDYRVGIVCLTFLLPWSWSPVLPQAQGFNVINFLLLACMASLAFRRASGKEEFVWLPREMVWCYLIPIAIAAMIAWPYLPIGDANFPPWVTGQSDSGYTPGAFLKGKVIKPMFFVAYAFGLANAVRDSKKPERFLLGLGLSAIIPAFAIIGEVLSGVDVTDRRHFLADLGLQVNEFGTLLALSAGPLLFICAGTGGSRTTKFAAGAAFGIVSVALLMTASRSAAVAYIVIVAIWLLQRRRFSDLVLAVIVVAVLVAVIPDQVQDRLVMGLDNTEATDANNRDDPLTKGRVAIWAALAPEFFESPLWGKGLSSTAWNSAVSAGRIYVGHPHNMFLSVLLDLGLLGAIALAYLYFRYARTMFRLRKEVLLLPLLRDYFSGAFAAYIGMLCSAFTGGYYTPHPAQTYLWFSLGFCFAYWKLVQQPRAAVAGTPFGLGVKNPPARPESLTVRR